MRVKEYRAEAFGSLMVWGFQQKQVARRLTSISELLYRSETSLASVQAPRHYAFQGLCAEFCVRSGVAGPRTILVSFSLVICLPLFSIRQSVCAALRYQQG